jgi:hypothetical protein
MEPAGTTPTTPLLQRSATVPVKRKTLGDGDVDIKRVAAAASIRPGWMRQELKKWIPIVEKPHVHHLLAAAKERAAASGFDLKCTQWSAEKLVEWLEKTELPPGWSHRLTPTTPLGSSASSSAAKQAKINRELGNNRASDNRTARALDLNSTETSSPHQLLDLTVFSASRTAEATSRGATQDGTPGEEDDEVVEEEDEDEEDGNKEPKEKKKIERWGPSWYDSSPRVSPHRSLARARVHHSLPIPWACSLYRFANVIAHTMDDFVQRDKQLVRAEVDAGMGRWYWRDIAVPHFNTKDAGLNAQLTEHLFPGDSDFADATFVTAHVVTTDSLRIRCTDRDGPATGTATATAE